MPDFTSSLLPSNSADLEHALDTVAKRNTALPVQIDSLFNPDTCPAHLLGHLAWSLSVDVWSYDWPERVKRNVCRLSLEVHRQKGTLTAIKRVLTLVEFGNATILEGRTNYLRDGTMPRDGFMLRGSTSGWATYKVLTDRLLSVKQANIARRLLTLAAPARCHLWGLDFTAARPLHNGVIYRNGQYTRGVA